jgi:hypothetical protein
MPRHLFEILMSKPPSRPQCNRCAGGAHRDLAIIDETLQHERSNLLGPVCMAHATTITRGRAGLIFGEPGQP